MFVGSQNGNLYKLDPSTGDTIQAYAAGAETNAWRGARIHWRAYTACWAAKHGLGLEGDFVECGVERGGLARTIIEYLEFESIPKRYWLLDTFCGLDEAQISPLERERGFAERYRLRYPDCYAEVQQTFSRYPNVEIVRGVVPDTLPQVTAEKVAYLSIDMNCVAPEIAAAEFFWPKMSSGALMVLDDYGFDPHIEQKKAFDQFAARHGVMILSLPTGQGMILKP